VPLILQRPQAPGAIAQLGDRMGSTVADGDSRLVKGFSHGRRGDYRQPVRREVKRKQDQRRREQIRSNGPRESFSLAEIGERDLWRCGICQDPIDPSVRRPDPRSASVDHIKPVAIGGTHTRDNVRITHLFCNMDRSYIDEPTRSSVRVVRDPTGRVGILVGDIPPKAITGEVLLDRRMLYPRTPEEARARLARRVERYERTRR
jgi:HNH endonuclease